MWLLLRTLMLVVSVVGEGLASTAKTGGGLPIVNMSVFFQPRTDARSQHAQATVQAFGQALEDHGFLYLTGHGVSPDLRGRLLTAAKAFFALPMENKMATHMSKSGKSWRGYFPLGEELTSGKVDQKEGVYFGKEATRDDARPLHGSNMWPTEEGFWPEGARFPEADAWVQAVNEYMLQCERVGQALMQAIEVYLGLPPKHLRTTFADPLVLFRAFHYPPHNEALEDTWAVGKHSDYGYLTLLLQDGSGGLEVQNLTAAEATGADGSNWVDVPAVEGTLVVNIGDALEFVTGGLLRATPHRVRPQRQHGVAVTAAGPGASPHASPFDSSSSGVGRLSFPFFFDPGFDSTMQPLEALLSPDLQARAAARRAASEGAARRWDGKKVGAVVEGLRAQGAVTYGDYVLSKVSKVFPGLAELAFADPLGLGPNRPTALDPSGKRSTSASHSSSGSSRKHKPPTGGTYNIR